MNWNIKNFCRILYIVSGAIFLFAFYKLSSVGFISDSEIWAINLAKHIKEEWMHSWVFTRPLFYTLLSMAVSLSEETVGVFQAAKLFGAINASVILTFTFLISRQLSEPKWKWFTPFIAVVLLLTNTGFLNQGYRIRSDLLASSLLLISIYLTLRFHPKSWKAQNLIWLSPLLATPKAVFFVLPYGFYKQERRVKLITFFTLASISTITLVLYPQLVGYIRMIFSSESTTGPYLSRSSFFYLERLIEKNPLFFLLFALRFLFAYLRQQTDLNGIRQKLEDSRFFSLFVAASVLVLIFSPDKNPFLLASFLPLFSIFTGFIFEDAERIISSAVQKTHLIRFRYLSQVGAIICCLSLSTSGWIAWLGFLENNNNKELYQTISSLDSYLEKYPQATLYDVVGIIPKRSSIREFAGPNDPVTNKNTADRLKVFLPDLIFYVRKGFLLEPDLTDLLKEHYRHIGSDVFGRWQYFGRWIDVNTKNKKDLSEFIRQKFLVVGTKELAPFYVITKDRKNKIQVEKTDIQNLFSTKNLNRGIKINGISVFSDLETPIKPLKSTIGFDWDQ